jgi:hypothetical protein
MYLKIIDHPNLVRDSESGAVLNIDLNAKESFLAAREKKRQERFRIDTLESDVKDIKEKMDLMLELLRRT